MKLRFEKSTQTIRTVPENYCVMSLKTFAHGGSFDAAINNSEELALLMAAAPDLYEKLNMAIGYIEAEVSLGAPENKRFMELLRSAVQSAEGVQESQAQALMNRGGK